MSALLQVVSSTGQAGVATVHVASVRGDPGLLVEMVDGLDPPQPRRDKWIVNLSTQLGCPVGCPYCDAGGGFRGHLSVDELLAQVSWILAQHPEDVARCRKLKVHFARMGEPAYNDAVISALWRLPEVVRCRGLWACLATVAPRGRERFFEALLEVKRALFSGCFQLQFSINSTDPQARARLVPVPHWSLDEVRRYGERFVQDGDRRAVLNFALAAGVPFAVDELLARFDPTRFAVKLTPLNPTQRGAEHGMHTLLRSPDASRLDDDVQRLRGHGFDVILSVGDAREDQVGSNCGQAVRRLLGRPQMTTGQGDADRPGLAIP